MSGKIYFDYAATTPVAPSVIEAMGQHLGLDSDFGNPASQGHIWGHKAREAVENAREQVATLLNAVPAEIVWTSGATEANNLAIKGSLEALAHGGKHIVTSAIEHSAVLDVFAHLKSLGYDVTYIKPDASGLITPDKVCEALRDNTALLSLMHVNNELGTITDIAEIGKLTRSRGVIFHVDAAQSASRLKLDVREAQVDLLSLSGHKMYAPKGIGALFMCMQPRVRVAPQIHGGGHEQGIRSGTLPTHQIVGLGEAAHLLTQTLEKDQSHAAKLTKHAQKFIDNWAGVHINGDPNQMVPGLLNLTIEGVASAALMLRTPHIAYSNGSACTSASVGASHVLLATGLSEDQADNSVRISFGRFTDEAEVENSMTDIANAIEQLRDL